MSSFDPVRQLIDRVRARWRRLVLLQSATRASLALAGVFALALVAAAWTTRAPLLLAAVAAATALAGGCRRRVGVLAGPRRTVRHPRRALRRRTPGIARRPARQRGGARLVSRAADGDQSSVQRRRRTARRRRRSRRNRAAGDAAARWFSGHALAAARCGHRVCRPRHDSRGGRRVGAPAVSLARRPPGHARQRPPALGFAADDRGTARGQLRAGGRAAVARRRQCRRGAGRLDAHRDGFGSAGNILAGVRLHRGAVQVPRGRRRCSVGDLRGAGGARAARGADRRRGPVSGRAADGPARRGGYRRHLRTRRHRRADSRAHRRRGGDRQHDARKRTRGRIDARAADAGVG